MKLGMEVGRGPGYIVLDGDPAASHPNKGAQQPTTFRPLCIVAKRSPISATAEFLFWGELCPHLTVSPGPRPTSVPSGILIHPIIWPQYTNVTDRTDRQTTV